MPFASPRPSMGEFCFEHEDVAGNNRAPEAAGIDSGKERYLPLLLCIPEHRYCRHLRERFDDENAGHYRPSREVPLEEPVVMAHVLIADGAPPGFNLDDSIDQK